MNKRCIINVATTDFYIKKQERLINTFSHCVDNVTRIYEDRVAEWETGKHYGVDLICWSDIFPSGSRPHADSPYGFKVHAFKAAFEKGYTSVLWCDAPAYSIKRELAPIFDKIEHHGYYVMSHVDPLQNSVGDKTLSEFKTSRSELVGLNLPSGSCYGMTPFNGFFDEFYAYEQRGFFANEKNCVDDVWYIHRHDEAVLAMIMREHKAHVFLYDPYFQSDSELCIIRSGE